MRAAEKRRCLTTSSLFCCHCFSPLPSVPSNKTPATYMSNVRRGRISEPTCELDLPSIRASSEDRPFTHVSPPPAAPMLNSSGLSRSRSVPSLSKLLQHNSRCSRRPRKVRLVGGVKCGRCNDRFCCPACLKEAEYQYHHRLCLGATSVSCVRHTSSTSPTTGLTAVAQQRCSRTSQTASDSSAATVWSVRGEKVPSGADVQTEGCESWSMGDRSITPQPPLPVSDSSSDHYKPSKDSSSGSQWEHYLELCREYSNEYYILAARMFAQAETAYLNEACCHTDSRYEGERDDFCLPWKAFAGCEWWDTLKVPDYESLSPSDPSAASTDHGECHNMLRPTSSTKHIKKTPSSPCHNKTPSSFCLKKTPPSSYHNLCPLSESSSVGSSIREYFVEQVKLQTSQMLGLLRSILPGLPSLVLNLDTFSRCLGAIRINAVHFEVHYPSACSTSFAVYPESEQVGEPLIHHSMKDRGYLSQGSAQAPGHDMSSHIVLKGFCLLALQSSINHSCAPNSFGLFETRRCFANNANESEDCTNGDVRTGLPSVQCPVATITDVCRMLPGGEQDKGSIVCCSNAWKMSYGTARQSGPRLSIFALRSIAKDEEIFIDYLCSSDSKESSDDHRCDTTFPEWVDMKTRGSILHELYGFTCECPMCRNYHYGWKLVAESGICETDFHYFLRHYAFMKNT
eukprot:GHVQ01025232.1.p1 GENE.GHVQ01025232.1~~GHVQ01025232.1.p1  ORF type:complete len:683 (+),score=64.21 GHVQ01025232.1:554-2602(+)